LIKSEELPNLNKLRQVVQRLISPSDLEWADLYKILQIKKIMQGDRYLRQGEPYNFGCFVVDGLLELYYTTEDGSESTFRFSKEYEFAAGYVGLLTHTPSECSIRALEASTICEIAYPEWLKLMAKYKNWETVGRKVAEVEFVNRAKREELLLIHDAKRRYLLFKESRPDLLARVPQHKIASYLGMTPVSLSRIVGQLRQG
jgi:CRP-like cAMP-binding protein